jgi:hypothetical protein
MSNIFMRAKYGAEDILDIALWTVSSDHATHFQKFVSSIAIAVFTVCSLGYYGAYAHSFFENRKVKNLSEEVRKAIIANDLEKIKELFKKTSVIKKSINGLDDSTPSWLHMAIAHQDNQIAAFLIEQGANINAKGLIGAPLEEAIRKGNVSTVQFLLDRGALLERSEITYYNLSRSALYLALIDASKDIKPAAQYKMAELLIRNGAPINHPLHFSLFGYRSFLYYVAKSYNEHSDIAQPLLKIMVEKGAEFNEDEEGLLSQEAKDYIDALRYRQVLSTLFLTLVRPG